MLGVLVVWSGTEPCLDAIPIPPGGLTFGRAHADDSDDRISREHARIAGTSGALTIDDLQSRNGTWVNGALLTIRSLNASMPAVIRTGRTVGIVVPDIRKYQNVTLTHRDKLVVGASLANAMAILDRAAIEESHIGIVGPMSVGRQLAHIYADMVGGTKLVVDLDVASHNTFDEKVRGAAPRTVILELDRPLTLPDQPELAQWLETDVRIVTVARGWESFQFVPKALTDRVTPRAIELPQLRYDELPMTVADRVRARVPGATVHATLIESVLLRLRSMNEDRLMRYLDDAITRWQERTETHIETEMRGADLDQHITNEEFARNCIVPRRRRPG